MGPRFLVAFVSRFALRSARATKRMTTAGVLAGVLSTGPALSEEVPDQLHDARMFIRARLLGVTAWSYERAQSPGHGGPHAAQGKLDQGRAWFTEKNGKVTGHIDDGLKCDSEVTLKEDGFDMATCADGDKRFVQSADKFTATFGYYTYTLRPTP